MICQADGAPNNEDTSPDATNDDFLNMGERTRGRMPDVPFCVVCEDWQTIDRVITISITIGLNGDRGIIWIDLIVINSAASTVSASLMGRVEAQAKLCTVLAVPLLTAPSSVRAEYLPTPAVIAGDHEASRKITATVTSGVADRS